MKNIKDYQEHFKKMKEYPEYKIEHNRKIKEQQKEKFRNIKPFETADDVPDLPRVDEKEWIEYYVPILIEKGAIPKKDLVDGEWYYGEFRNSNFGRWNAKNQVFDHIRYKFGYRWDECNHFEDDNGFALFVPIRKANKEEIEEQEKIINKL